MNKTYLCVLPLALLLAGSPDYGVAQETECKKPAERQECKEVGESQAKTVNLNINSLNAKPQCVRVHKGGIIVFKLTPKKDIKDLRVEIRPKNDFDSWLRGNNDDLHDLIIIRVPGTYEPDEQENGEPVLTVHNFGIYLSNGECRDPRVEVQH